MSANTIRREISPLRQRKPLSTNPRATWQKLSRWSDMWQETLTGLRQISATVSRLALEGSCNALPSVSRSLPESSRTLAQVVSLRPGPRSRLPTEENKS